VPLHLTTSWVDKDYNWGRPDGRPFSPEHLTLEEWLILYSKLPAPGKGPDYMRAAVPEKMRAVVSYDEDNVPTNVTHMNIVEFRGRSWYSGAGYSRDYIWYPIGMSKEVKNFLRTAGVMNPFGSEY
jgi:hypothetical protein